MGLAYPSLFIAFFLEPLWCYHCLQLARSRVAHVPSYKPILAFLGFPMRRLKV